MNKKITIITLLVLAVSGTTNQLTARSGGSGAGLFFGGLATGAVLSSATRRSNVSDWRAYAQELEDKVYDQEQEIRDLKQELRQANRQNR
jgi:hypothetical protein